MQFLSRALCAAILLNSAAAYAGVYPIYEGKAFTLDRSDFEPEVPVWLQSETATSVSFSLWGIEDLLNTSTDSSYMPWNSDYKSTQNAFEFVVNQGYKITSIQVTGTFKGTLHPAEWTMPGDANNHLGFGLHAGLLVDSTSTDDVHGTRTFSLTTGATALEGEFGLSLNGSSESYAKSIWYLDEAMGEQYWLGSQASAGITDLVLTVNVSPVPEPGTWAMLAAGLLGLGGAGRLRRRNAEAC
jgi:hypothetical protein